MCIIKKKKTKKDKKCKIITIADMLKTKGSEEDKKNVVKTLDTECNISRKLVFKFMDIEMRSGGAVD